MLDVLGMGFGFPSKSSIRYTLGLMTLAILKGPFLVGVSFSTAALFSVASSLLRAKSPTFRLLS